MGDVGGWWRWAFLVFYLFQRSWLQPPQRPHCRAPLMTLDLASHLKMAQGQRQGADNLCAGKLKAAGE